MADVTVKNLSVSYGDKVIFSDFSITFAEGKISVVLGRSGIGKSTLLNCIAGLLPHEGEIKGVKSVGYVFQKDRLIPNISVYQNLDLVLKGVIKSKAERIKRIGNILKVLGIDELSQKLPKSLSGGELQRVAMARAYLYPCDVLLLDEPFKALDAALKGKLFKELIKLNEYEHRTVVFVTHAVDECLLLADDYFVLDGNPCKVADKGEIMSPKSNRTLSGEASAKVREKLLVSLLKE